MNTTKQTLLKILKEPEDTQIEIVCGLHEADAFVQRVRSELARIRAKAKAKNKVPKPFRLKATVAHDMPTGKDTVVFVRTNREGDVTAEISELIDAAVIGEQIENV